MSLRILPMFYFLKVKDHCISQEFYYKGIVMHMGVCAYPRNYIALLMQYNIGLCARTRDLDLQNK